jgi:hypothetical protein
MKNKEFAVLVGRAFLKEIDKGDKEAAIAFGRAFLLALGMKGPEPKRGASLVNGRSHGEHWALAEN